MLEDDKYYKRKVDGTCFKIKNGFKWIIKAKLRIFFAVIICIVLIINIVHFTGNDALGSTIESTNPNSKLQTLKKSNRTVLDYAPTGNENNRQGSIERVVYNCSNKGFEDEDFNKILEEFIISEDAYTCNDYDNKFRVSTKRYYRSKIEKRNFLVCAGNDIITSVDIGIVKIDNPTDDKVYSTCYNEVNLNFCTGKSWCHIPIKILENKRCVNTSIATYVLETNFVCSKLKIERQDDLIRDIQFLVVKPSFDHGVEHKIEFNWQQLCSFESALRTKSTVNFWSNIVPEPNQYLDKLQDVYKKYFNKYDLDRNSFDGDPLERTWKDVLGGRIRLPFYQEASDIARTALLYKYGGIYQDDDVIITKYNHYSCMANTLGVESTGISGKEPFVRTVLNGAIMSFSAKHPFVQDKAARMVKIVANTPNEKPNWGRIGPKLATKVYSEGDWDDITIHPTNVLYPIWWSRAELTMSQPNLMKRWLLGNTMAVHLTHRVQKYVLNERERCLRKTSAMYQLMKTSCPVILESYLDSEP